VVTGRALRYSSLVSTLCHELAHLRHFHHGPEFQDLYQRLLAWARREGIYRPRGARGTAAAAEDPPLEGEELRAALSTLRLIVGPPAGPAGDARADGPVQLTLFEDEA
jgi:hypothetical protein